MNEYSKPSLPEDLFKESEQWIEERSIESQHEEIKKRMQLAYVEGVALYLAHKEEMKTVVQKHGGIEKISYSGILEESGTNKILYKDGETSYLDEFLGMKPLEIKHNREGVTQKHTIQVRFGGTISHNQSEATRWVLNYHYLGEARPFETLLNDDTYFPEDIGITERVNVQFHDKEESFENHYSLYGLLWRPNPVFNRVDAPNPHTDPVGYRRWALEGDKQIDLEFRAPTEIKNSKGDTYTRVVTVIDKFASCKFNKKQTLNQFDRFCTLLDYYGKKRFPDSFTDTPIEHLGLL